MISKMMNNGTSASTREWGYRTKYAPSHTGDRATRADSRNRRQRIHVDVRGDGGDAAHQIEHDEANMAKAIFDVVAEYPEEQHVAEKVSPAGVQEHRREHGEHGESQQVRRRTRV